MNRNEFMRQLESLLQNISPAEREAALQYYNDYFDDAGAENEQEVLEALGNPARVAENIKKDLYGSSEYGEAAYQKAMANNKALVKYQQGYKAGVENEKSQKKGLDTWVVVLIVILCIFASPVILGAAGTALGALVSLLAGWFSLILGFGAAALGLLVTMLVLGIIGAVCIPGSPIVGLGLVGGGLVCGGLGLLFLMLTVAMAGIATPAICKGIVSLCKKLFGKKEAV